MITVLAGVAGESDGLLINDQAALRAWPGASDEQLARGVVTSMQDLLAIKIAIQEGIPLDDAYDFVKANTTIQT